MFKTLRDKITLSGTTVLMVGVALLIFTFASSYGFLVQGLSIITSGDLVRTFGEALAPLIASCIHIMYLGVMGWIGSILTIRGVTILSQARQTTVMPEEVQTTAKEKPQPVIKTEKAEKEEKPETKQPESKKPEPKKPEPKKPEAKPPETKPQETKPYEPEIVVLTPEPVQQKQQESQQKPQQPQPDNKQAS